MPGLGEREQARERRGARGQRGVEVETGEVIQNVGQAASGIAYDGDGHSVRGVGHESARMAQDELDVGVLAAYLVADKQKRRAGRIEQEVDGERRNLVHRGAGQFPGVDEDHGRTRIQRGEEVVLAVLAEVGPRAVGKQHHPVGV